MPCQPLGGGSWDRELDFAGGGAGGWGPVAAPGSGHLDNYGERRELSAGVPRMACNSWGEMDGSQGTDLVSHHQPPAVSANPSQGSSWHASAGAGGPRGGQYDARAYSDAGAYVLEGDAWRGHPLERIPTVPVDDMAARPQQLLPRNPFSRTPQGYTPPASQPPTVPVVPPAAHLGRPVPAFSHEAVALAEHWIASTAAPPVMRTPSIMYPSGIAVNFSELAFGMGAASSANAPHRARIVAGLESGELLRRTMQTYVGCDRDRNGYLSWNNGEIRSFLTTVFQQQGLCTPGEQELYQLYTRFDVDRNSFLDARECLCIVDALLRAIAFAEPPRGIAVSASPQPPAMAAAHFAASPAQSSPLVVRSTLPVASPGMLPVAGCVLATATAYPPQFPGGSPLNGGLVPMLGGGLLSAAMLPLARPLPAPPPLPQPSAAALAALAWAPGLPAAPSSAMPPQIHAGHQPAASSHGLPPHLSPNGAGGQHPLQSVGSPPRRPAGRPPPSSAPQDFEPHDIARARSQRTPSGPARGSVSPLTSHHRGFDEEEFDASYGRSGSAHGPGSASRPTPAPAPKPPRFHEQERRPHMLEVELEELELFPEADHEHLRPGWFESLKYFISLHPHSEHHDDIPLPRDAPRATVEGEYLVSQTQLPKHPGVQVGASMKSGALASDKSMVGEGRRPINQHPVVTFREQMALTKEMLDTNMVAYVWGRKASITSESVTLIGRALAPLHEFEFQRRSTTWGVSDVVEGHQVAEMRLRYHVSTTPGPVQLPKLADSMRTEVTVKWEPPESDHGAPILGYKVAFLLENPRPGSNEGPSWFTLCECTKSTNPVYVVANLAGNTTYTLDIAAVNKVGPGDGCEFQVSTAPVEPDPPSKPWVDEARDGCLNIAWKPPASDGGLPILAYRIRMRKLVGGTTFNQWHGMGPGEKQATWVDMGSVGSRMCEEEEDPSVYNAWVGPLEATSCEYRFQIIALNKAGESKGSELSDAQYT